MQTPAGCATPHLPTQTDTHMVKEGMIKGFTPRRIVTGHDSDGMSFVTSDSCVPVGGDTAGGAGASGQQQGLWAVGLRGGVRAWPQGWAAAQRGGPRHVRLLAVRHPPLASAAELG